MKSDCFPGESAAESLQDLTCLIWSTHKTDPPSLIIHQTPPPSLLPPPVQKHPPLSCSSPALIADRYLRIDTVYGSGVSAVVQVSPGGPPPLHAEWVWTRKTAARRSVNYKRSDFLRRNWTLSQSMSREGSSCNCNLTVGRRRQPELRCNTAATEGRCMEDQSRRENKKRLKNVRNYIYLYIHTYTLARQNYEKGKSKINLYF